jgi:hypothetical protein
MDAGKLVELGTRIVAISVELSGARAARDEAQSKVLAMETELMPLLAEHAKLIGALAGSVTASLLPTPAQPQYVQPVPGGGPSVGLPVGLPGVGLPGIPAGAAAPPVAPGSGSNAQLKQRVFEYLKRLDQDEPVSASDVADVLKVDSFLVREAMMEMRSKR